jgi:3-hydroxyacyl-[acyl-carrier-protein] dehydratase
MYWCWIDRVIEFHSGRLARAVKNISLAETHLRDHFPAYPLMPNSLVIEGMGQTGMLLALEAIGYTQLVLLAKIPSAQFSGEAVPGDALVYSATISSIMPDGICVVGRAHCREQLDAEAELLFARVDDPSRTLKNGNIRAMVKMMQRLGVFSVGVAADGSPLRPPAMLTECRQ